MAVRNFWIDARVDGRTTNLSGGPQAKSGGFSLDVCMRDNGKSYVAVTISGAVDQEDPELLHLTIHNKGTDELTHIETRR